MFSPFLRPARLVLLAGLISLGGSAAEAGNFGVNLNIRTSTPNLPQTTLEVRHVGPGPVTTPAPPVYQGPGQRSRSHAFDPNKQFDGTSDDNSTNGKWPK